MYNTVSAEVTEVTSPPIYAMAKLGGPSPSSAATLSVGTGGPFFQSGVN